MFNAVVQIELLQVEGILAVTLVQYGGGKIGSIIAEGWRKVKHVVA